MRSTLCAVDHSPMAGPGHTRSARAASGTGAAERPERSQRELSRRAFVRAGALLGVGGFAAAGGLISLNSLARVSAAADLDTATATELALRQWAFVFDLRRCDGCGKCTTGCQKMHHLPEDQEWIKVYTVTGAGGQISSLPVLCQMCERPPCVQVCPVAATFKEPDGVILIDQEVCIGCRMCMAACPYGVRTFNWDKPPALPPGVAENASPLFTAPQRQGTVGKCDSCAHRLRDGDFPACVTSCSMEAIYVGDLVADVATNGRETVVLSEFLRANDAFRLKEELGTQPRVYYIAGHGQALDY
jgi:molybdopterin-containing oxidoreductase family iron-sulfur binding subunit